MWVVYILHSSSLKRFYTGCTKQLGVRLQQHANEFFTGSFTSKAKDWDLKLVLNCLDETHAKAVEKHIKQMKSGKFIYNLIQYEEMQQKLLQRFLPASDC